MKNAINRLKLFLGLTKGYKHNPIDRDGDGIVQEGTPNERKVAPAKKPAAKKKAVPKDKK
jgi:hypothetical protein